LNNASASYRSMSSSDMDFGVKSKKLIDNDDNKPEDNSGTITTSNTTDYTVKN